MRLKITALFYVLNLRLRQKKSKVIVCLIYKLTQT
nr:MAG TPA: hypothetical protein [Caudoviricetes sp.]